MDYGRVDGPVLSFATYSAFVMRVMTGEEV